METEHSFSDSRIERVGHPEHNIEVTHGFQGHISTVSQHGTPSQSFFGPNAVRDARAHAHNLHMASMLKLLEGMHNGSQ
jgi:hypothetical protein